MKISWIVMGFILAACANIAQAQDQQPAPTASEKSSAANANHPDVTYPKQVRVQVELIELSHEALTKLLFLDSPQGTDATPLRKQLQEMVTKNDAKVLETHIVVARSGQKATTESLHEFIYPTEYQPPALPGTFGPDYHKETSMLASSMPTAFETRNLGSTLEIEPTVNESGKIIDLRFVPELVWHTGDTLWGEGKDALGMPFRISMPDMYTMRINTAITCVSGQYTFVGALSPKDAKGNTDTTRKVMVFVKCDVLTVK